MILPSSAIPLTILPRYLHCPGLPWLAPDQPLMQCGLTTWLLEAHLEQWQRRHDGHIATMWGWLSATQRIN